MGIVSSNIASSKTYGSSGRKKKKTSIPSGYVAPKSSGMTDAEAIAAIQGIKQGQRDTISKAPLGPGSEGVVLRDPFVGSDVERAYTTSGFYTPPAATSTTGPQPAPTGGVSQVATTGTPVIDRSIDKPDKTVEVPMVDIRDMGREQMFDFVDAINFKQMKGEAITDEEQMKLMKVNRALSMNDFSPVENAAEAELIRLQNERDIEAARVKDMAAETAEREGQVVEDEFDRRREREITAGERQKETQLRILGDNAFSSKSARALGDIDDAVSENIRILDNMENAQMQRVLAEQAGASSETLQSYDSLIAQMQGKVTELNISIAEQTNAMNMEAGASYQEKIQNIMTVANTMPAKELDPSQQALAGSYADLLIDSKGDIDGNILKMIPAELLSSVMMQAAVNKGAVSQEKETDYSKNQWEQMEDGRFMRTNPVTGELEIRDPSEMKTTPQGNPIDDAIAVALEKCATGAQCGKFVNDILQETGYGRLIGDEYSTKENAIRTVGEATSLDQIGAGSIFSYPVTNSKYGHIGIVTGVNGDGTVNIMDYNYKGDEKQRERSNVPVGEILEMGGMYSVPIITEQTVDTPEDSASFSDVDIMTYNSPTFKPQKDLKTQEDKDKYAEYVKKKNEIFSDKDASIEDILSFSAGGKDLSAGEIETLGKFDTVINQLEGINKQIKKIKTGPILGKLKGMNPYSTDAQVLKTQLTALIPGLARGVYGEVGVLTDTDIRTYARTIPNLEQTEDVRNAVLALTLDTVAGGYKKQLQVAAAGGRDVSLFAGLYENLTAMSEEIKSTIPEFNEEGQQTTSTTVSKEAEDLFNSYFTE